MTLVAGIKRLLALPSSQFRGVYDNWETAYGLSQQYPWDDCLKRVIEATLAVRDGESMYQRDSVRFNDNMLPASLLYVLTNAALISGGRLNVVDFGGGLGGSYFHCKKLLPRLKALKWTVIEQEVFVEAGKSQFETAELRFSSDFDKLPVEKIDVIIYSSVLHYLRNPYDVILAGLAYSPATIFVDRLPTAPERQTDFWTIQIVPDKIFPSRVPMRVFGDKVIPEFFERHNYFYLGRTDAIDPVAYAGMLKMKFSGYVFRRKE